MPIGKNFIDLKWTEATSDIGVDYYTIYRSSDGFNYDDGLNVGNILSYSYGGLSAGTQYWFKITATDTAGPRQSEYSNVVTETTLEEEILTPTGINVIEL